MTFRALTFRRPSLGAAWAATSFIFLLWTSLLFALPSRTGWVTDGAGVLTPEERGALHQELDAFEKQTGFEVAVVVVRSLEGKSVEDYSYELAKSWRVGKVGKDNGVILLLAMSERKSRIETGKGVGHLLTDVESADILDQVLRPRMKAGKVAEALTESTRAIQKELQGVVSASPGFPASPQSHGRDPAQEGVTPPHTHLSSSTRPPHTSPGTTPLPWLLALGAGGGLCYGVFAVYGR
ncbi:MAG: TPM domain-containing protein, partial [Polyangiaceae bacterium]|nr:TPM domain-containing protein [Polyangiaceae bacterium]